MREKKPSKYIRHEGFATGGRVVSDEEFEILQKMKWPEEKKNNRSKCFKNTTRYRYTLYS